MRLFRRKAVEIQRTSSNDGGTQRIEDMPEGTRFTYLGRHCVVIDYAPDWAGAHLGLFGMEFHYADERGIIRQGRITPRNFKAFRSVVEIDGQTV